MVEVVDVAFGGKAVTRLPDGRVCFVPDAITGERIEMEVVRETKRFAEGRLLRVVQASVDRVKPPCPYFGVCGGCSYQHISYERQIELKASQVRESLRRIGGVADPEVKRGVPSPEPYGYRNRITVHRRGGSIGFHRRDGRGVVDVDRCLLASDPVNRRLAELRKEAFREGPRTLREHESRAGFHQTNDAVAELLLGYVEDVCAAGGPVLIDAYCGDGFFARRLAPKFGRALGIEWNSLSVARARELAGENETYCEGDVAEHLATALSGGKALEATVILDPPAQGLDARVCEALEAGKAGSVIYVSCNPGTFARDMKALSRAYEFLHARPFDMFPQTAEVEIVGVFRARP